MCMLVSPAVYASYLRDICKCDCGSKDGVTLAQQVANDGCWAKMHHGFEEFGITPDIDKAAGVWSMLLDPGGGRQVAESVDVKQVQFLKWNAVECNKMTSG